MISDLDLYGTQISILSRLSLNHQRTHHSTLPYHLASWYNSRSDVFLEYHIPHKTSVDQAHEVS
jgi:hypothetical protein